MTVTSFGARAAPKMVRRLTEENGFRSCHLSYNGQPFHNPIREECPT